MRAVVFAGPNRVRVDDVPAPGVADPEDAVVQVSLAAICASDLHVLSGKTPGMREGAVIGHEFVGRIRETGPGVRGLEEGERVVGSFLIACGRCASCRARRFNHCAQRRALGLGPLVGDLDGAQAEYVRVPYAGVNLRRLDRGLEVLDDDQALFAGDVLAAAFHGAALAGVGPGETAVVVGAGPVGLLAAEALRRRRARAIVLDTDPKRASFAREGLGLEALEVGADDAEAVVADATQGRMGDAAVEAAGALPAFRTALRCVRDGGVVVVLGVYGAERYDLPMGRVWVRGLDIRFAGMANVQAHWDDALGSVARRELDPTAVITHRLSLDEAERGYDLFASREAMKVVLEP